MIVDHDIETSADMLGEDMSFVVASGLIDPSNKIEIEAQSALPLHHSPLKKKEYDQNV